MGDGPSIDILTDQDTCTQVADRATAYYIILPLTLFLISNVSLSVSLLTHFSTAYCFPPVFIPSSFFSVPVERLQDSLFFCWNIIT